LEFISGSMSELGVSVEIELRMDWQGCKKVKYIQILLLSVDRINMMLANC